jgi:hypothetical protein
MKSNTCLPGRVKNKLVTKYHEDTTGHLETGVVSTQYVCTCLTFSAKERERMLCVVFEPEFLFGVVRVWINNTPLP